MKKRNRLLSLALTLALLAGSVPANAEASGALDTQAVEVQAAESEKDDVTYVLAGGDFQYSSDNHTQTAARMKTIMNKIKETYSSFDGFLFTGDYNVYYGNEEKTANGHNTFFAAVQEVFGELNHDNSVLAQGDHDFKLDTIDAGGGHDFEEYSVYVLNEDAYSAWDNSDNNGTVTEEGIQETADELKQWLDAKIAAKDEDPIFVASHVGLSYTTRTNVKGDAQYAKYIFDVLQEAGEALNIIFLFGHNHSSGYDEWLGGEAIYLPEGDQILIAEPGSRTSWTKETLKFTYMNSGYVGYYDVGSYVGTGNDGKLTMTVFSITDDQVKVERFNENGLYDLKKAGDRTGVYADLAPTIDKQVWKSPQLIERKEAVEKITQTDSATGVSAEATGLSGLTVKKSEGTVSEGYSACVSYELIPENYTDGHLVTITIPLDESIDPSRPVILIDREHSTMTGMEVKEGSITFHTDHFGTYELAQYDNSSWTVIGANEKQWAEQTSLAVGETYILMGTYDDSEIRCAMENNSSNGISAYTVDMELTAAAFADSSELPDSVKWVAVESSLENYVYLQNVSTGRYLQVDETTGEIRTSSWNWESSTVPERYYGWAIDSTYDGLYAMNKEDGEKYYICYSDAGQGFETQNEAGDQEEVQPYRLIGNDAACVQLLGLTSYVVDNGSTEAEILAAVKAGMVAYTADDEKGTNAAELPDQELTWNISGNETDGFLIKVSYEGTELAVAEASYKHPETQIINVSEVSCTEDGYTGDTACAICGEIVALGDIIPAPGHSWGKWTVITEATEETEGLKEHTCSVCSETEAVIVPVVTDKTEIPAEEMTVTAGDEELENSDQSVEGPAILALDGDENTFWHTDWYVGPNHDNHWLQLEFNDVYLVTSFSYLPRQSGNTNGTITGYKILVSMDGKEWTEAASGNWAADTTWKKAEFDGVQAKYVRLKVEAAESDISIALACAAEVRLTGKKVKQPTEEPVVPVNPFTDVSEADYFYDAVLWAVGEGITTGRTSDAFAPYAQCSRADVVTFLYRAMNGTPSDAECVFTDVNPEEYYYEAMMWAVEKGITKGMTETTFSPYATCTRADFVTLFWRALGGEVVEATESFEDVTEADYFYNAVLWAVEKGVTTGLNETTFGSYNACYRGDTVTFIYRALDK